MPIPEFSSYISISPGFLCIEGGPFVVPGVSEIAKANTFYEITNMILKLASEVGPQGKV